MSRELPILFAGEMVRAILYGRKTQTRRPLGLQPPSIAEVRAKSGSDFSIFRKANCDGPFRIAGPVWAVRDLMDRVPQWIPAYDRGDLLYVRETFNFSSDEDLLPGENHKRCPEREGHAAQNVVWRADGERTHPTLGKALWRPSIHMPKWAARIWLRVRDVRIERVQDISEEDARAEGIQRHAMGWTDGANGYDVMTARDAFAELWGDVYPGSWDRDDWVWVYEFERVSRCADADLHTSRGEVNGG